MKIPSERKFMFRSYNNNQWKSIDISKLDLSKEAKINVIPVYDGTGIKDITDDLIDQDNFLYSK